MPTLPNNVLDHDAQAFELGEQAQCIAAQPDVQPTNGSMRYRT